MLNKCGPRDPHRSSVLGMALQNCLCPGVGILYFCVYQSLNIDYLRKGNITLDEASTFKMRSSIFPRGLTTNQLVTALSSWKCLVLNLMEWEILVHSIQ